MVAHYVARDFPDGAKGCSESLQFVMARLVRAIRERAA